VEDLQGICFPPAAAAIYEESRGKGFDLVSEPLTGCLLRTLVSSKPRGSFLELGTGTGAATAWILDGMDSRSRLVTVESDERLLAIARRHLGADPRVTFVPADGNSFLREARGSTFDLIFADTWPGKYESLESALGLLKEGGLYVVDDMDPQATWPLGHEAKVAALLRDLTARRELRVTRLSWASGIVVAARTRGGDR
jgi:predicted O-methyltransferase YrrM